MESVPLFLAHAVALEDEAAQRYDELADALEVHNNPDVVDLFRKMAHFSRLHLAEARERAESEGGLPQLKPWEYQWPDDESPESAEMSASHYLMTPAHALRLAHAAETAAHRFYDHCARNTGNATLRGLAAEFAAEESEHAAELESWMALYPEPDAGWDDDMDPPVSVD
ncbi:rubrerythrin [Arhodomonas aquaeolei]|uniref:ferritin family protein n=1 Tax=Arhodomonas aquaeolei TaxID=2369 RepID=UPI00037FB0B0|nr:ferritin family protein [Arhodomonas aquaeolei]MCS4505457.1 rubrerythrin [Arhodomonas aquaeolei]